MIRPKIISGGQTGADIAGLMAAKDCGFDTGGWMPAGFRTLDGPRPEYAELYGMKETKSFHYPERTAMNVINSDFTLRFALFWDSRGEQLTLRLIKANNKPWMDINPYDIDSAIYTVQQVVQFHPNTINIAGNSEQTCPGIQEATYRYLTEVFNQFIEL